MEENRLKTIRENIGATQAEFAKALGVHSKYISMIECGKRPISYNFARKVAETFPGENALHLLGADLLENMVAIDQSFEEILISAERYACGRRTYVVKDTVSYILALLPHLSNWCIGVMQNDLKSEFGLVERSGRTDMLGDDCDYRQLVKFRDELYAEMKRRAE